METFHIDSNSNSHRNNNTLPQPSADNPDDLDLDVDWVSDGWVHLLTDASGNIVKPSVKLTDASPTFNHGSKQRDCSYRGLLNMDCFIEHRPGLLQHIYTTDSSKPDSHSHVDIDVDA